MHTTVITGNSSTGDHQGLKTMSKSDRMIPLLLQEHSSEFESDRQTKKLITMMDDGWMMDEKEESESEREGLSVDLLVSHVKLIPEVRMAIICSKT